jgi:hypothetical protein
MKEMLEQFGTARFLLTVMSGTAKVEDLRKQVMQQAGEERPYEQLSDSERDSCDEAVAGLQQLNGIFEDIVVAKARLTRKFFSALQKEGFSAEEALAITAAQPVEVKGGN